MVAYVICQIEWRDPAKHKEYQQALGPTLEKYGGKTLVAGVPNILEGAWDPTRTVVIEFPSMAAIQQWYASAEYAPVLALRKAWARTNLVAVERPA